MKQFFPFLLIMIYSDDVIGNIVLEFPTVYLKTVKEIHMFGGSAVFHYKCELHQTRCFYLYLIKCISLDGKETNWKSKIRTSDKSGRDGCVMLGIFCCSEKGQAIPRNSPALVNKNWTLKLYFLTYNL